MVKVGFRNSDDIGVNQKMLIWHACKMSNDTKVHADKDMDGQPWESYVYKNKYYSPANDFEGETITIQEKKPFVFRGQNLDNVQNSMKKLVFGKNSTDPRAQIIEPMLR
jgi:nucleoside-specific outer membrane channel protein Tsx